MAKFAASDFDCQSPRIIESFLSNKQQRTKINNALSSYSEILYGVPLTPLHLLFNIFIYGKFFDIIVCDIVSYVDDNTRYILGQVKTM